MFSQSARFCSRTVVGLVLAGCGAAQAPVLPPAPTKAPTAPVPQVAVEAPETKQLAADTPVTTASGASFEAPKNWFMTKRKDLLELQCPERDLAVSLIEVEGENAEVAITTAWQVAQPGFDRKVAQTTKLPAKDGWDAITQIVYEVPGAQQRTVVGVARRKGNRQYVALIDGANAAMERRGAQLMTVISTLKAAGVAEESFAGKTARLLDAAQLANLNAFITESIARTEVPGAAIAVIQGGKVVQTRGFGIRQLGKPEPVRDSTLFMIGSTTKSLTTLMMAKLVDEGKFSWDTPVVSVLPAFALGNPETTRKVTMQHTVCACTGLPRQDMEFLFEYANATPESRVKSMSLMQPTTGFGETFQYSNTLVATGGYVAAHAADPTKQLGPGYDATMQSRVFTPLGMTDTTFDFARAQARDHAMPHGQNADLAYSAFPLRNEEGVVAMRPAGAAWSSVKDMSKYVLMELSAGKNAQGAQVVSEANLRKRREPQVKISDKMSYGLGLFLEADHGVQVVHHGGNNLGFTTDMFFLPEHGVGVVLLSNGGGAANALRRAVRRKVMELLFDGKPEAEQALTFRLEHERDAARKDAAKLNRKPDAAWAKQWIGAYSSTNLGNMLVRYDETAQLAIADFGEWTSALGKQTESDGTVKVVLLDPPWTGLAFAQAAAGSATTLTLETPQQQYVFTRAAAKKAN
jgi:CubicO group peptidase (beta-lactamase class C family)